MFRKNLLKTIGSLTILVAATLSAQAQTGQLRGHVIMQQADGSKVPASEATIDVYRMDLQGSYNTKTNKKGEFVFAGLPYVGNYIIAASYPGAAPQWLPNVKVGRDIDYELSLGPGDGKRLTYDQIKAASSSGGPTAASSGSESASDKAKRAELEKKNAEIMERNKKAEEANTVLDRTFKAGNEALKAKNYDAAIAQYDEGLAADPDHPGAPSLLTNKSLALRFRGVERYNSALTTQDEATKNASLEAAKKDFKESAEASNKAVAMLKTQGAPTDPAQAESYKTNLYFALVARAEAMRLFVTKVEQSQVDAGYTSFQEYLAAETDPVKKSKAEHDMAQMFFDANQFERALAEYQKILASNPDDLDALLRSGQALFNIGAINNDKAKYQEAANFLAQFVQKAPDTNALKADAKAILDTLKDQENVKPEKTTTPTRRRRP